MTGPYQVVFRPEARLELEEALHWYEEKRGGLGCELLLVVDNEFEELPI